MIRVGNIENRNQGKKRWQNCDDQFQDVLQLWTMVMAIATFTIGQTNTIRVIDKKLWVQIIMIRHTIFTWSNTILSDQDAFLLSYNNMEEVLVKILLDQDYRANKFCPIICVFARSYDRWSTLSTLLWISIVTTNIIMVGSERVYA